MQRSWLRKIAARRSLGGAASPSPASLLPLAAALARPPAPQNTDGMSAAAVAAAALTADSPAARALNAYQHLR